MQTTVSDTCHTEDVLPLLHVPTRVGGQPGRPSEHPPSLAPLGARELPLDLLGRFVRLDQLPERLWDADTALPGLGLHGDLHEAASAPLRAVLAVAGAVGTADRRAPLVTAVRRARLRLVPPLPALVWVVATVLPGMP